MHQTRKTHNAHNETQKRLMKVLSKGHTNTWYATPHYPYIDCRYGHEWYVPDWQNPHWSNSVHYNIRGGCRWFDTPEEAEQAKKHNFLVKSSKSSGRSSYYKFAKKMMHKWWRKRKYGDITYTIRGSHCSWEDIIF